MSDTPRTDALRCDHIDATDDGTRDLCEETYLHAETLERELSAARAEIERLRVWVCHNGGVLNEWGREWNPAKHPPLTDYIRQRLDAAIDKERQK